MVVCEGEVKRVNSLGGEEGAAVEEGNARWGECEEVSWEDGAMTKKNY